MACSSKRPFVLSSRREIARAVAKIAEVSGLSSPKGSLWRHPIRHPLFEAVDLFLGPRVVAGHAAVFQAREDAARLRAHVVIRREVEAERLHGLHMGIVAKQGSNISAEAESHKPPPRIGDSSYRTPCSARGRVQEPPRSHMRHPERRFAGLANPESKNLLLLAFCHHDPDWRRGIRCFPLEKTLERPRAPLRRTLTRPPFALN